MSKRAVFSVSLAAMIALIGIPIADAASEKKIEIEASKSIISINEAKDDCIIAATKDIAIDKEVAGIKPMAKIEDLSIQKDIIEVAKKDAQKSSKKKIESSKV